MTPSNEINMIIAVVFMVVVAVLVAIFVRREDKENATND